MSESVTENMVAENAQMKNGERNWNKMELFLSSEQVLCLGICMSKELATSHKESETIGGFLGDSGAK